MYCGVMLITDWKLLIMKTVLKLIDGCKDVWMHAMMLDDDAWMTIGDYTDAEWMHDAWMQDG